MDIFDMNLDDQAPPEKPTNEYEPHLSNYQRDYFDAVRSSSDNIQLDARAGCGKSYTLVRAVKYQPDSLVLAFAKQNQLELEEKLLGTGIKARTFNSVGSGLFWKHNRTAELNDRKVYEHLYNYLGQGNELVNEFGYAIRRTISLVKNNAWGLLSPPDPEELAELIDSYGLEVPSEKLPQIAEITREVFIRQDKDYQNYDFDDQLYVPIKMGWPYRYASTVLVDEDQDLSPIQHCVLDQYHAMGSRILGVGDDRQAIYGFKGALTDSVELLRKRFSMRSMPLPICYRCPKVVIAEAQKYVPDIQARPDAPEGFMVNRWASYDTDPEFFGENELVLCRTNAPLFKAILRYVRARRPCRVETNFLEQIKSFLKSFKVETTSELLPKLDSWFLKEKEAAEKKGFKGKVAQLQDKYDTCVLLAMEFKRVWDIIGLMERLTKSTTGTRFSTVHKAKGTEEDDVYILRPDLMPSPFAVTKEQMRQEINLLYVAITRARHTLTWGMPQ